METLAHRDEDQEVLLAEIERFGAERCAPLVARPERPMDAATFGALLEEAEAIGLGGSATDPSGLGPWERLGSDDGASLTLQLLEGLGRVDAALAYALHQRSLARAVCRRLGVDAEGPFAIAPRGHFGLGRDTLGALLLGRPLGHDARALLSDLYAAEAARIVAIDPGFSGLLTPALDGAGHLFWQLHRASTLERRDHAHAHGLDAMAMVTLVPRAPASLTVRDAELGRTVLAEAMAADQLGLLAISTGSVAHAAEAARRFAAVRRQGGLPIARHAAVLDLLGRVETALAASQASLEALGAQAPGLRTLPRVLAARALLQPSLADAANAALQVFGGLGYMRDNGLEKIVRDVNCLRAFGGSPLELRLAVAGWESTHD